jgi:hypothetical protein
VTIIGGPRVAVTPVTVSSVGLHAWAIPTIMAVVSREVFGLINRMRRKGHHASGKAFNLIFID